MKKTLSTQAKEPIRLRSKKLANGNLFLYLDFYRDGKREYEFLKLYLVPEKTKADKIKNEETLRTANAIKRKRLWLCRMRNTVSLSAANLKSNLLISW